MVDTKAAVSNTFSGVLENLAGMGNIFLIVVILAFIGGAIWLFSIAKKNKQIWNLQLRIRQEDTINKKIPLDAHLLKMRRVTLSNGIKMLFLQKPVLGKRLMPLLNYYTRPGVYDIVLTSDNRIFLLTGIEGIDKKRKLLNVGLRYPGIDQDFDELNNDYKKLNEQDTKNNFMDIIKAAGTAIAAICLLIAIIIGGKYWVDGKKYDASISQSQVEIFETLEKTSQNNLAFGNSMNLLVPKLQELLGTKNLQSQIILNQNSSSNG